MATRLALELSSEEEATVAGQWERAPDAPWDHLGVAKAVDDTLEAIAEETESKVRGKLAIYTSEGKPWVSLPVRADPKSGGSNFEGNNLAFLQQVQKSNEALQINSFRKDEQLFTKAMELISTLTTLATTRENRTSNLESELARVRDENAALRAENMTAEQLAEQAVNAQEEALAAVEAAKNASSDDSKMQEIFVKALQSGPVEAPKKPKRREDAS